MQLVMHVARGLLGVARKLLGFFTALLWTIGLATAQGNGAGKDVPSFAQLEAAGAVIGEIRIDNQDIFDLDDSRENNALFRLVNWLHVRTRPEVIRKQLLFNSGEPLSARLIDETERLLRATAYLYDVSIRPLAWHDGVVDIEVQTRDTWTFMPGASLNRAGGFNNASLGFKESNLLGTGMKFDVSVKGSSDSASTAQSGTELQFLYPNAFDGRTAIGYAMSNFDDGSSRAFSVDRPFYALDARRAAALAAAKDDRLVPTYASGELVSQFRRRLDKAELSAGWSEGLVDGWAHRYSVGFAYEAEAYSVDPGMAPPPRLPDDRMLVGPFLRHEAVQDNFRKLENRNLIARTEIFALGFHSLLQFGRALTGLGSTQYVSIYSGIVSKGFELSDDSTLLASTSFSGEHAGGRSDRQLLGGTARYYLRQDRGAVFFASFTGDRSKYSDAVQPLTLGGENGLRGYPARHQSGDRRVLFTAEQRFYTDWYPFRLLRVGGAVFYDVGRAWGGPYESAANAPWLNNVGFGVRILSARSATGTTLHVDFAFPLNRDPGISSYQFSFMSKTGF